MRKITGAGLAAGLFIASLTGLFSCSYTPGTAIPKDFRTIHIYTIFNDTDQPDLGMMMKDVLYDQFNVDGRLIPIDDPDKADILLAVKIQGYTKAVSVYSPQMLPDQILLGMEVAIVLQNVSTQKVINNQVIRDKLFYNLITTPQSTEYDAKKQLIDIIAKKIMLFSIEGFY
jgi:hypothetical protein